MLPTKIAAIEPITTLSARDAAHAAQSYLSIRKCVALKRAAGQLRAPPMPLIWAASVCNFPVTRVTEFRWTAVGSIFHTLTGTLFEPDRHSPPLPELSPLATTRRTVVPGSSCGTCKSCVACRVASRTFRVQSSAPGREADRQAVADIPSNALQCGESSRRIEVDPFIVNTPNACAPRLPFKASANLFLLHPQRAGSFGDCPLRSVRKASPRAIALCRSNTRERCAI